MFSMHLEIICFNLPQHCTPTKELISDYPPSLKVIGWTLSFQNDYDGLTLFHIDAMTLTIMKRKTFSYTINVSTVCDDQLSVIRSFFKVLVPGSV